MEAKRFRELRVAAIAIALAMATLFTGCVGLLSQIGYWAGGATVSAAFAGLKGKRVAVICVSESSALGPGTDSLALAQAVGALLGEKVENIKVVRPDEMADWIDRHDWDEVNFVEAGKGVNADLVVAIELSGFGLYEGKTLYKGRANLTVSVLDLTQNGKEVFRRNLADQAFPVNSAYPTTDASESRFRRTFIQFLAGQVAKFFYDYEIKEDFSRDSAILG